MSVQEDSTEKSYSPDSLQVKELEMQSATLPKEVPTGTVETIEMVDFDFEKQRRTFQKYGRAQDPSNPQRIIGAERIRELQPKQRRIRGGDAADIDGFLGPWAGYEGERKGETAIVTPSEEEVHRFIQEKSQLAPATLSGEIGLGQEKSIFHGREERNYLGRSYITPIEAGINLYKESGSFECFAPKKLVHTWTGHTKGINAIRFIPKTGHLLLSAGQDQRIKLWNVYGERECLRTFYGHNKPAREVNFSTDGRQFISCAFDKTYKVWDTETGKCTFYKEHKAIPYCVRMHPADPHTILVGTADRKVIQWDLRGDTVIAEYHEHADAVNTITFYDANQRFVTSSDDKTLRIWEFNKPANSRLITDSEMPSMPFAVNHPSEPLIAFQSLDNRIRIYSAHDTISLRNKRFIGHATSGYACQIGFSPDGKYIFTGDGRGFCIIWDWNSGAIVSRIESHRQVCMGVEWNPQEPSRVATCSWDGTIKYWD